MDDIQKMLHSYKHLISSGLLILGAVAGVVFVVRPAAVKVMSVRDEVRQLAEKNLLLKQKLTVLEAVDEQSYTAMYTELLRAVPADQSLVSLFATVDGLGATTGVTIGNFSLSRSGGLASESAQLEPMTDKTTGSILLSFSMNVEGSYGQIRDFLAQVTQVRRILRVRSFDFVFSDPQRLSMNVLMETFYKPHPTSVGAVDRSIEPLTQNDSEMITRVSAMPIVVGVGESIGPESGTQPTVENKADLFEP